MTTTTTSPRKYRLREWIPGHGFVIQISDTAYGVTTHMGWGRERLDAWVPFYGPNGVDEQVPASPLVVF